MKRILKNTIKVLLLSTVVFSSISIATAQKKAGYTLKGTMTDLPSGKIYLEHTIDKKTIKDSTNITNGNFEFKGSTSEPIFYTLYLSDKKNSKSFLMENAAISFVGKKDSLYKAKVKGSKVNDIYIHFYEVDWKPVTAKAGDIYGRMDKAEKAGTMKSDPSVRKGFDAEFSALSLLNDSIVNAYAKRNSASVASAVVIFDRYISYPYFDNARALMPFLSKEVKESSFGKQITEALAIDTKTAVGKTAPTFSMANVDGKVINLRDFNGKYVLIDFWASWCGPCRKENPNVVAAYNKYHDKGFEILGISLDSTKDAWLKAIKADGLTWNHVSELKGWTNSAATLYGVKSVPASFLIGPDGKIVGKDLRGEDLHNKLASIFAVK